MSRELLKRQEELAILLSNSSSQVQSGKSNNEYRALKEEISKWFAEFKANHTQMLPKATLREYSKYFEMGYFEKVSEIYEQSLAALGKIWKPEVESEEVRIESAQEELKSTGEDDDLGKVQTQFQSMRIESKPCESSLKGNGSSAVKNETISIQKKFLSILQELRRCHARLERGAQDWLRLQKIEEMATDLKLLYVEHFDQEDQLCEEYETLMEKGSELLQYKSIEKLSPPTTTSTNSFQPFCLPKVEIPIFYGDYSKWIAFRDIFTELFCKESVGSVHRMIALKAYLRGEALRLVDHLGIAENNFPIAWRILEERYADKRLITSQLFKNIVDVPSILTRSSKTIKYFHDTVATSLRALEAINLTDQEFRSALLHFLIVRKLDYVTKIRYEESLEESKEIPKIGNLLNFLQKQFKCLEDPERTNIFSGEKSSQKRDFEKCILSCEQNHNLQNCDKFKKLNVDKRNKVISDNKLCKKCLKNGHIYKSCKAANCCKCSKPHHELLHNDNFGAAIAKVSLAANNKSKKHILVSTALVQVKNKEGKCVIARAVLDNCSQGNFITSSLRKKLGLKLNTVESVIEGVSRNISEVNRQVTMEIQSEVNKDFKIKIDAIVLKEITPKLPGERIDPTSFPKIKPLADPTFYIPQNIDILLGAEIMGSILNNQKRIYIDTNLYMESTVFGWVVIGPAPIKTNVKYCGITNYRLVELDKQVQRFWDSEDIRNVQEPLLTKDEKECEEMFESAAKIGSNGRFNVPILFKNSSATLGDSKQIAIRRFYALEKKLTKNDKLKEQYSAFLKDYLDQQHMEEIKWGIVPNKSYFMPHHCVLRPDSTTTKLRVVFDASCKTTSGVSLNDVIHSGPKLQEDIFNILVRFRKHTYVVTADIEKMYRQIALAKNDQNFQLIVWRWATTEPLKVFRLKTVTYGTSSAPYLATKCLQKIADRYVNQYPRASNVIKRDFYMDDLMTGGNNLSELQALQEEVKKLLENHGFHLRKWCSNHPDLLKNITAEECEIKLNSNSSEVKALGLIWSPHNDELRIKSEWEEIKTSNINKRVILSDIAKLFDPLGIVNPVVVKAKIFLQDLWRNKLDWNENIPENKRIEWLQFREQLPMLKNIKLKRHMLIENTKTIELHGFCDASEKAYGAVVYTKSVNKKGYVRIALVSAKSRVAPIKTVTIPRLELCAAVLLTELMQKVSESLNERIDLIRYHTDSEIVLAWIKIDPGKLKVYEANRVATIQRNTDIACWSHISTKNNPADLISRGLNPKEIVDNTFWFEGPEVLKERTSAITEVKGQVEVPGLKAQVVVSAATLTRSNVNIIDHRNKFKFLRNVTALILKLADIIKKREILNMNQYREKALESLIKADQQEAFSGEIKNLKKEKAVLRSSKLSTLSPFLDEKGIIRVGGRIQNSAVSLDTKHPILLPYNNILTKLIMTDIHETNMHVGARGLLALTRRKYWPLRGKQLAAKIIHACYKCFRTKPRVAHQYMGSLPIDRVTRSRPFEKIGVDFLGPLTIHYKLRGARTDKAYVCSFICFASKAVHLEVVSNLSTVAFIGALKRFIGRRGCPSKIYSDNATNFVGAKNCLQEVSQLFKEKHHLDTLDEFCAQKEIQWCTIPARSPHMGGLWEASVKSVKTHFRIIEEHSLTFEQLTTIMIEIEAILNSRPLTSLSDDPNDFQVLTPAHFLIGTTQRTIVDDKTNRTYTNLRDGWQEVQKCVAEIWKRWSDEYLTELQQRYKWRDRKMNVKPGALVLLKEENLPPLNWKRGRVMKAYCGPDGLTRTVKIKTVGGETHRAIHTICPFPPDIWDEEIDQ